MSRSYKKTPISKSTSKKRRKTVKKIANRRVRYHKGNISCGRWFSRLYDSWEIDDYIFYCPYYEDEELYENKLEWEKYYKRK